MQIWSSILEFLRANQIGDVASLLGLIGLGLTFWQVWRAKSAAQASQAAAESVKETVRVFDTIVDFSAVISLFEDIKRMHRQPNRHVLLERYATARKMLIVIRTANMALNDEHQTVIQTAISTMATLEKDLEKSPEDSPQLNVPRYNSVISNDIDNLVKTLIEIKQARVGVQ